MNTALHMDCMAYMKTIGDRSFDLAVVDPPYGINATKMKMGTNATRSGDGYPGTSVAQRLRKGRLNSGGGKLKNRALQTMNCDWDFAVPSEEYFDELFRVSKHQIIFGGNYFRLPPSRGIGCWDKKQPWSNFSAFELIWTSFDCPAFMIRYSSRGGSNRDKKIHPTQKPIEVYTQLYEKFSQPGYKVIDTHLGSGSSRIAARKFDLDFVGCEIDELYFQAQETRFLQHDIPQLIAVKSVTK